MDPVNIATILVSAIAAFSAYASQRAAAKASTKNAVAISRVDMEKEAYDRARAYDTETIRRQDLENDELRAANRQLVEEIKALRARNSRLENNPPETKEFH